MLLIYGCVRGDLEALFDVQHFNSIYSSEMYPLVLDRVRCLMISHTISTKVIESALLEEMVLARYVKVWSNALY